MTRSRAAGRLLVRGRDTGSGGLLLLSAAVGPSCHLNVEMEGIGRWFPTSRGHCAGACSAPWAAGLL